METARFPARARCATAKEATSMRYSAPDSAASANSSGRRGWGSTCDGGESSGTGRHSRNVVRSTTARERPTSLATKQYPEYPVALCLRQPSRVVDANNRERRDSTLSSVTGRLQPGGEVILRAVSYGERRFHFGDHLGFELLQIAGHHRLQDARETGQGGGIDFRLE